MCVVACIGYVMCYLKTAQDPVACHLTTVVTGNQLTLTILCLCAQSGVEDPDVSGIDKQKGPASCISLTNALAAGESVVVARGGKGGMGVNRPTKEDNARLQTRKRRFLVSFRLSVSLTAAHALLQPVCHHLLLCDEGAHFVPPCMMYQHLQDLLKTFRVTRIILAGCCWDSRVQNSQPCHWQHMHATHKASY